MLKNYLNVSIRNLRRHWIYFIINLLGLTIGLTCALYISAYIIQELSYNQHFDPENRIYRVMRLKPGDQNQSYWETNTQAGIAPTLERKRPEIERAFKTFIRPVWVTHKRQSREAMICLADTAFIDYFALPAVSGNTSKILRKPGSAMITTQFAKRLFGDADPIGKTVSMNYKWGLVGEWVIEGILQDHPTTTSELLTFDFLSVSLPSTFVKNTWHADWIHVRKIPFWTWAVLKKDISPERVEAKFQTLLRNHLPEEIANRSALSLQPLHRIHLYTKSDYGRSISRYANGDINTLHHFAAAGILILLIAAANFVNLTTAQATTRALEVGVRKTVGASRKQLMVQFITESMMVTLSAALLAFFISKLIPNILTQILGLSIATPDGWTGLLAFIILALIIGLLSTIYPAIYLSGFNPSIVLKRIPSPKSNDNRIRKGLVVFQFFVSAILLMSTIGMTKQISFLHKKDLGFNKEQLVTMPLFRADSKLRGKFVEIRNAFMQHPNITHASASLHPVGLHNRVDHTAVSRQDQRTSEYRMAYLPIDDSFRETFGLQLIDGKDLEETLKRPRCMLNETAARMLNYYNDKNNESPIGQHIWMWNRPLEVVGVVKDFQHSSLHTPLMPLVMLNGGPNMGYLFLTVRIRPEHIEDSLTHLKKVWHQYAPGKPFDFQFLDETYAKFYQQETTTRQFFTLAAALAIFTGCLGILGLAAHTVRRRTKEVGIRRVLGASDKSIFILLSQEFIQLVTLANLAAIPIAWFALDQWLQSFAYRTTIGWLPYLIGITISLAFALLTVAWQAQTALRMKPVDTLRNE